MKWVAGIIAILAGLYAAYMVAHPTYSYRFRITIEVNTADGTKSGSSVLEVKTRQFPRWVTLGNTDHETTVRGEAVFVDIGNGRNLVALLALGLHAQDGAVRQFAPRSFFTINRHSRDDVRWAKELSTMAGRRPFAGNMRPTLVTFGDPKDPATVREVPFDNPQSVLGPDVRSVRSWIDLTTDAITSGLRTRLPWIGDFKSAEIAVRSRQLGSSSSPLGIFKRRNE